jgi:hypothetical protein
MIDSFTGFAGTSPVKPLDRLPGDSRNEIEVLPHRKPNDAYEPFVGLRPMSNFERLRYSPKTGSVFRFVHCSRAGLREDSNLRCPTASVRRDWRRSKKHSVRSRGGSHGDANNGRVPCGDSC